MSTQQSDMRGFSHSQHGHSPSLNGILKLMKREDFQLPFKFYLFWFSLKNFDSLMNDDSDLVCFHIGDLIIWLEIMGVCSVYLIVFSYIIAMGI